MKNYLLILIFLFLSFTTFGKTIYTLSKDDFIKQFNDSSSFVKDRTLAGRIYCHNEKGNKVWLSCGENSILIARLNDNNEKKLMLTSIKYRLGEIQAKEYSANEFWVANRKINKYKVNEITSFTIEEKDQKYEKPYFDIDSMRVLCANKNDSIKQLYSIGNEYVLFLTLKNNRRKDTFLIMENACYHMKFKDNSETVFGIVQKVTKDSIVISSTYNQNMANWYKKEFKIYHFPINDISEIKLLKTGGYSFKIIKIEDVPFEVIERKKEIQNSPIWYSFDARFGEINFYRAWFTDGRQYQGITEKEGKPISYEW